MELDAVSGSRDPHDDLKSRLQRDKKHCERCKERDATRVAAKIEQKCLTGRGLSWLSECANRTLQELESFNAMTRKNWARLLILSGFIWSSLAAVAWSQAEFRVANEPVLTLRTPDASSRLRLLEQRFQEILSQATSPQLQVSLETPSPDPSATPPEDPSPQPARILLNGQLLLEVTAADAKAHSTPRPIDLAQVWGDRLQTVLDRNQRQLFFALGLPKQLSWRGRSYTRADQATNDLGRFVTDGSRIQDRVVYWEIPAGEDPFSFTYKPVLPDPPPERLFLLNRYRQFVPYEL